MKRKRVLKRMIHRTLALALLLTAGAAAAEPVILTPMSSHAVIQRDRPLIVTGTADPGEAVTIAMGSGSVQATADAAGYRWGPRPLGAAPSSGKAAASPVFSMVVQNQELFGISGTQVRAWFTPDPSSVTLRTDR